MSQFIYKIYIFILCGFNICMCLENLYGKLDIRNGIREELVVKNVSSVENFKINLDVSTWKSIALGPFSYVVGLMENGIAVVTAKLNKNGEKFVVESSTLDFESKPVDSVLFVNWKKDIPNIVLVVATSNNINSELLWYTIEDTKLEKFWSFSLDKNVSHINYFEINGKQMLLALTNDGTNQTNADLYQFDVTNINYWFHQSISLSNPTKSSALNKFGPDYYLSIPQKSLNKVLVYKFINNHFKTFMNISSQEVDDLISFEIGFKSFIAFDGFNAGIYQFTQSGLIESEIQDSNLEGIEYWTAVPVSTYRDEVILLAQRSLDHGSHESLVIEIITYNGLKFEEHEDIPCSYFGEILTGLLCLTGEDTKNGIIGIGYLGIDDKLGLLVPMKHGNSILYEVNFQIDKKQDPVENQLVDFMKMKERLQQLITSQNEEYSKLHSDLKYTVGATKISSRNKKYELPKSVPLLNNTNHEDIVEQRTPSEDLVMMETLTVALRSMGEELSNIQEKVEKIIAQQNKNEYKTVVINGIVDIQGEAVFDSADIEKFKGETSNELLEDIVRADKIKPIPSDKTFTDLAIDELIFDKINGISSDQIIYKNKDSIKINGTLTFTNPAEIMEVKAEKVNDIIFENEVIDVNKEVEGALVFEEVIVENRFEASKINNLLINPDENVPPSGENVEFDNLDTLFIPQNLTIKTINGEHFDTIIGQLCLINTKCYIPGKLIVNGDIFVNHNTHTDFLNGLKYPDEFVSQDNIHHYTITGQKTFVSSLTATDIRLNGLIDGIKTEEIITLSKDQNIPGKLIFEDVEIKEALHVDGNILGEHLDKFLPNPILREVDTIKANVNFKELEVEGSIFLENKLNELDFNAILEDIVYKDEEVTIITGKKDFPEGCTVTNNLQIESEAINNTPLEHFVTKDTDQVLVLDNINGNVNFENLYIEGLFGTINITKLDQEIVKLTGEQYISSTLIFSNNISVNNLEIVEKLNDLTSEQYLFTDGDKEFSQPIQFNDIQVENMFVEGNLKGDMEDFDINDFNEKALSYTKNQKIEENFRVESSDMDNIQVDNVNNNAYSDLFDIDNILGIIKGKVASGEIQLKNLFVNGSLHIDNINDKNFDVMLGNDVFRSSENGEEESELIFESDVYFEEIEINHLGGVNFETLLRDIVYRNETSVDFVGTKQFVNGFKIHKLIETTNINNVPIDNILLKEGEQIIVGPLTIHGDVTFNDNFNIEDYLNDLSLQYFLDNYKITNDSFIVNGDMVFSRLPHIYSLNIEGFSNDKHSKEFFKNLVLASADAKLLPNIIFENHVTVEGNLGVVKLINGIDLSETAPQIVLITKDEFISGLVTFTQPIYAYEYMGLESDLLTKYIFGIDLNLWMETAVFIDRGMLTGDYAFDEVVLNEKLIVQSINDIGMNQIISLQSNQTIDYLFIEKATVFKDIHVGNLVNGYRFENEMKNTVMVDIDQEISSNITFFGNVLIREVLETSSINNIDVNKLVTTNTDQNLSSIYNFTGKTTFDSNLYVYGTINNINVTSWDLHGIKKFSPNKQDVFDVWYVKHDLTFEDDVQGKGLINELDLHQTVIDLEEKRNHKYSLEKSLIDDYTTICKDIDYIYQYAKGQIYKFKYFDEMQHFDFENGIEFVYYFKYMHNHYLIAREHQSCISHLLIFNETLFLPLRSMNIGYVTEMVPVYDDTFLYLVTRSDSYKCEIDGTNVWDFKNNEMTLIYNIEPQLLLQDSLVPGTFYGMNKNSVSEYKIITDVNVDVKKYRIWDIKEDNMAFIPRGLKTGLAVRTGHKLIKLLRKEQELEDFDYSVDVIIKGNITEEYNYHIPGRKGEVTVLNVGAKNTLQTLLAVASHEETTVKGRSDFVKIYWDIKSGIIFQKVPTYKPSSVISIEFGNGETLLAFMEDEEILQIYEYKGIEGFIHRSSSKLKATKLFQMTLPIKPYLNERKVIGTLNGRRITLLQSVMSGNQIRDELHCEL